MASCKKRRIKLVSMLICIVYFCFNPIMISDAWAETERSQTENTNEVTLLLDEAADVSGVEAALYEINPSFMIKSVKEIGLIYIESPEHINIEELLLNPVLDKAVLDYGNLMTIEQEGIALSDAGYDSNAINLENVKAAEDQDKELLDALSWHVDAVTEERKSLDLSIGNGVEIALIDSGVDYLHPLLQGKINLADAKSYIPTENTVNDTNSHGTMVAGVIVQIAPGASITPYRVIAENSGESLWTIEAIIQAVNDDKDIISMSLGTYKNTEDVDEALTIKAFERAINYAVSNDAILVSSSGNLGLDLDAHLQEESIRHLPGSLDGVWAVSATTRDNSLASYSNYGSNVQFAAPGGDIVLVEGMIDVSQWIYTAYPLTMDNGLGGAGIPQGYTFSIGTSLSAPAMTAGVADFITYYRLMTGEEAGQNIVKEHFINASLDLGLPGYDTYFGNGLININNVLLTVEDKLPPAGEISVNTIEINSEITAADLVSNISDNKDEADTIKIYFEALYNFSKLGAQEIGIVLEDLSGNKKYLSSSVTVVDTLPPTGKAQKATIKQREVLKVDLFVYDVEDNAGADQVTMEIVSKNDTSECGSFPVTIRLKDQSGNESFIESEVEIIADKADTGDVKSNDVPKVSTSLNSKRDASAPGTGDNNEVYLLLGLSILCLLSYKMASQKPGNNI